MFKELFKKSGYPIIPVAFICVILFSLFTVLLIVKNNFTKLYVKNLFSPLESVVMNVDMKSTINNGAFICYDDYCSPLENNMLSKVYHSYFNNESNGENFKRIKKITLAYPADDNNFINNINYIDIHIGNNKYYLSNDDILKLEFKKSKIELTNSETKKKEIKEFKIIQLSDKGNYRGIYNNLCSLFLSLFYNWKLFVIPYFWLFVAFIFYLFNKDEIKYNIKIRTIKPIWILAGICVVGILLRINNLNYFPLWTDEVYTKTVAIKDFLSCFKDPGNPPLFFCLEFIISKLIGNSDIALRILPFIFGIALIPVVYILFEEVNKKTALFASFMTAINTVFIYHSTEARGYTLSALLVVLSIYLLFKYLKNPTNKNLIIYGIITALCVNHNYYLILFAFCNFIWGVVDLIENKNAKKIPLIFGVNFCACLTFLPYFIVSSKNAFAQGFNGWIPALSQEIFKYTINEYFINKYVFIFLCAVLLFNLILIYLPQNLLSKLNLKRNSQKDNLLIYLVFNLALILILASIISIYIKPIFHKRVLLSVYSLLFLIEIVSIVGIVEFVKENKLTRILKTTYVLILLATCFLITKPMPLLELCRLDGFMNTLKIDATKFEKDHEIHAITCDTEDYLNHYPEIKKLNIKWHYVDTNSGNYLKNLNKFNYIDRNKKSVLYFHAISADIASISQFNPTIDVFKSNSISTARIIYEP